MQLTGVSKSLTRSVLAVSQATPMTIGIAWKHSPIRTAGSSTMATTRMETGPR
jgi:hypothetical protein